MNGLLKISNPALRSTIRAREPQRSWWARLASQTAPPPINKQRYRTAQNHLALLLNAGTRRLSDNRSASAARRKMLSFRRRAPRWNIIGSFSARMISADLQNQPSCCSASHFTSPSSSQRSFPLNPVNRCCHHPQPVIARPRSSNSAANAFSLPSKRKNRK